MLQAACCCGVCSCPPGTSLPSSVTVTIVITSCAGIPVTLSAVATLGGTCDPETCSCTKYTFSAITETVGGCQPLGKLCDMPYGILERCNNAQQLIGISSLGVSTNGVGAFDPPYDCSFWASTIKLVVGGSPQFPEDQAAIQCNLCGWFAHGAPCIGTSTFYLVSGCKFNDTSPAGAYPLCEDVCANETPGCVDECSSGFTFTSITVT